MPSKWLDWGLVRGQERSQCPQIALPFARYLNRLWESIHTRTRKPLLIQDNSEEERVMETIGFDSNRDVALERQLGLFC